MNIEDVPERERMIWENSDLMASLKRGLEQSAKGEMQVLDWRKLTGPAAV